MAGDTKETQPGRGDQSMGVFVSIYLLLLAFFVVLNSISNQEQAKAGAVIESVNSVFKKEHAAKATVVDLLSNPRVTAPNDEFLGEISGLLVAVLGLDDRYTTRSGDILRVHFPIDMLFAPGSAELEADGAEFFDDMIALLKIRETGVRREIEFIFRAGADSRPPRNGPERALAVRRAGNLARALIAEGLDPLTLSPAVVDGPAGRMTMVFRSRADENAAVTFAHLVEGGP